MSEPREKMKRHVVRSRFGYLSRSDQRELNRMERGLVADARRDEAAERMRLAEEEKAAWRSAEFLPSSGEKRPKALWTPRSFKAQPHRANSGILGLTYPFLADPGFGTSGILMGRNLLGGGAFVFDPFTLYEHGILKDANIIISAKIGEGKSTLMKALTTRGAVFGYRSYVPADVKGEWTEPARMIGGQALELGPGMPTRINPLALPISRPANMSESTWAEVSRTRRATLLESITQRLLKDQRGLEPEERNALLYALDQTLRREQIEPTLGDVVHELFHPETDAGGRVPEGFDSLDELREKSKPVGHALYGLTKDGVLGGILNGRSEGAVFDPKAPMVSVDVSRLEGNALLDIVMTCTSTWMEAALRDGTDRKRFMIYDEAWRVFGSPALLARLQNDWTISRNWGVANVMAFHGFGDLDTATNDASRTMARNLVNDSNTVISLRQSGRAVASAKEVLELTDTAESLLTRLQQGQAFWRIGQRMALSQITRTAREAEVFDTDEAMVTNAEA